MVDQASEIKLDHVGFVVDDPEEHRPFFETVLQAEFLPGPQDAAGFNACQWRFRNDMKIEFLQPARTHQNPFAANFISKYGPGLHHLTFQVPNLEQTIAASEGAGAPILYKNTDSPTWKEAFVHPKHGFGTVLQLAEFQEYRPAPGTRTEMNAALVNITLAAFDLDRARSYFTEVLGGQVLDTDAPTIVWAGPVTIDLVQAESPQKQGVRQIFFESAATAFSEEPTVRTDVAFAPGLPFSFAHTRSNVTSLSSNE